MKKKLLFIVTITLCILGILTQIRITLDKEKENYIAEQEILEEELLNVFEKMVLLILGNEEKLENEPDDVFENASLVVSACYEWNNEVERLKENSKKWYGFLYPSYQELTELRVTEMLQKMNQILKNYELRKAEEEKEKENAIKYESYTIYLEGNIVDYNTIDINQYKITIDDDKKSVYLSRNCSHCINADNKISPYEIWEVSPISIEEIMEYYYERK